MDDLENFVRASPLFGSTPMQENPRPVAAPVTSSGKTPPHSLEAERSFLGGLLLENQALNRIHDVIVDAEDFYRDGHQKIFRCISELLIKGDPADLVTVTDALRSAGLLERAGGASYLSTLVEEEFSSANVPYYAKIIKEKAILRNLAQTCAEVTSQVYSGVEEQGEFLDSVEKRIFTITEMKNAHAFAPLKDILLHNFQEIEQLANQKGVTPGTPSGFTDLDNHLSGFRPSQLIIVAARPGMGKTSFMLNIAKNSALESKKGVAIFSMEMSKEELAMRLLSTDARVDSERLKTGKLQEQDWKNLTRAAARLAEAPVYIDDSGALNLLEVKARCRRLQSMHNLGLVVIDYLQLMSGLTKKGMSANREQEIAEISRGLKALAKELCVPIVAASQLNRGVESRQDKRPMLSDLRESGAIEQDADVVLFIHREDHYNRNENNSNEKGVAEIIIGKHRSGQTGIVKLAWLGQYTAFEDLSSRDTPAHSGGF